MPRPPASLRALLRGLVDYAGLFPPANLPLPEVVTAYAEYRQGKDGWILGRLIVPVAQLPEFERAHEALDRAAQGADPWSLAALGGADILADSQAVAAFNERHRSAGRIHIDALELRTATPAAVERARAIVPAGVDPYAEVAIDADPLLFVAAAAHSAVRLKVRTGGVTRDAFPDGSHLARFVASCVGAGVPFKATAGLHHPVRAAYPLTYDAASDTAAMFGFLGLFLAPPLLRSGMPASAVQALLEEGNPGAFRFDEEGAGWRSWRAATPEIAESRLRSGLSFGSCAFRDPVDDLGRLGLL